MRRAVAAALAAVLVVPLGSGALASGRKGSATPATVRAGAIPVAPGEIRAVREHLDLARALVRTAPSQFNVEGDTARALAAIDAFEASLVVTPGTRTSVLDCVKAFAFTVIDTFRSIYYYWIHYPFYGIFTVEWAAQVMVRCATPL